MTVPADAKMFLVSATYQFVAPDITPKVDSRIPKTMFIDAMLKSLTK